MQDTVSLVKYTASTIPMLIFSQLLEVIHLKQVYTRIEAESTHSSLSTQAEQY